METTIESLKMSDLQAYDIPSFVSAYKISRAQVYKEISAGRLRIFKVGRTLISREAADAWRRNLEANVGG
jgi:hypothetical protein